MFFNDFTTENFIRANAAVERTLWAWEAVLGPTERLTTLEEGVFLLETAPWVLLSGACIQNFT